MGNGDTTDAQPEGDSSDLMIRVLAQSLQESRYGQVTALYAKGIIWMLFGWALFTVAAVIATFSAIAGSAEGAAFTLGVGIFIAVFFWLYAYDTASTAKGLTKRIHEQDSTSREQH